MKDWDSEITEPNSRTSSLIIIFMKSDTTPDELFRKELMALAGIQETPGEETYLKTESCIFTKGDVITHAGTVENYIYLLREGAVKISHFFDGREFVLDIWFPGSFFASYLSFIERTPSLTEIRALTPVQAIRLHYSRLEALYKNSLPGNITGRKIAERMYAHKTRKEIELLTLTAEERYRNLLAKEQKIVLGLPVKDIASYLGIHPESLSRIRRKVIS